MQILFQKTLSDLIKNMLILIITITFVVWLAQSLRFINMISNKGADLFSIIILSINALPNFILNIMPASALISIIYIYNKLLTNNEITILKSCGLNNFTITKPALIFAVIITIISFIFSSFLVPVSYKHYKKQKSYLQNNYAAMVVQAGVFMEPFNGFTIYIDKIINDKLFEGIMINDQRNPKSNVTLIAKSAKLVRDNDKVYFELIHGTKQEIKKGKLSIMSFNNLPLDISSYFQSSKKSKLLLEEYNLIKLIKLAKQKKESRVLVEINSRICWPLINFAIIMLAATIMTNSNYSREGYLGKIVQASVVSIMVVAIQVVANIMSMHNLYFQLLSAANLLLVITAIYIINIRSRNL